MMKLSKKNIIEVDKRIERLIYDNEDRPRYKVEVTKIFKDLFDVNYVGDAYTDDSRAAERVRIKLFDTANPKRLYDMLVAEDDYGRCDFRNFQIMVRLLSDIGRSKLSNTGKDEYFDKYRDILRMLRRNYSIKTLETIDSIGNPLKAAKRSLKDYDYDDDYYGYASEYDSGRRRRRGYSSFDDDYDDREPSDAYYDRILSGTGIGEGSRSRSKSKPKKKYSDIYDDIDDYDHDADIDEYVDDDYTKDDVLEMATEQIKDLTKVVAKLSNKVNDMSKPLDPVIREYTPVTVESTVEPKTASADPELKTAINNIATATQKNSTAINNMAKNIKTLSENQNAMYNSLNDTRDLLNMTVTTVNDIIDDLGGDEPEDNVTVVTGGTTIDEALAAANASDESPGDGNVNIVT